MVEGYGGDKVVLSYARQLLVDKNSLPATGPTHQHDWTAVGHQQVQEVAETYSLRCVDQYSLYRQYEYYSSDVLYSVRHAKDKS